MKSVRNLVYVLMIIAEASRNKTLGKAVAEWDANYIVRDVKVHVHVQ